MNHAKYSTSLQYCLFQLLTEISKPPTTIVDFLPLICYVIFKNLYFIGIDAMILYVLYEIYYIFLVDYTSYNYSKKINYIYSIVPHFSLCATFVVNLEIPKDTIFIFYSQHSFRSSHLSTLSYLYLHAFI